MIEKCNDLPSKKKECLLPTTIKLVEQTFKAASPLHSLSFGEQAAVSKLIHSIILDDTFRALYPVVP